MSEESAGLLNIHKPSGVTSFSIVRRVRRALGVRKVGHCGTLDPLAEGVLLVLFGKATKMQSLLMGMRKTYHTRITLGVRTDSGDVTGTVVEQKEVGRYTDGRIQDVLRGFVGEIEQIPPMYSALKHQGRRLYEIAREGGSVERKPRPVTIYGIELVGRTDAMLELRVECSSGTYVRTLAEDIGSALGCGATMAYLCREKSGPFDLDGALDGGRIEAYGRDELLGRSHPASSLPGLAGMPQGTVGI
jgi:tRNA pseudouridine55 synthase